MSLSEALSFLLAYLLKTVLYSDFKVQYLLARNIQ